MPANPKRVVCVDTYTVSALLDVGHTPVGVGDGGADVVLPKSGVGGVLADAGVRFGAASAGTAVHAGRNDLAVGFEAVSYEDLGVLDDASALITVTGADGRSDPDVAQMTTVSTFRRLPAARSVTSPPS